MPRHLFRSFCCCLAVLIALAGCGKGSGKSPPITRRLDPAPVPSNVTVADDTGSAEQGADSPPVSEPPIAEGAPVEGAPVKEAPVEGTPVETPEAPSEQVLYADSFHDFRGAIHWNRDGVRSFEGTPPLRTVYFFSGMAEGGPLTMRIVEDGETAGPDGKPGVLSLCWQEVPAKLPYSGFVYLGGRAATQRMLLP